MSGTMMDNKPSSVDPDSPAVAGDGQPASSSSTISLPSVPPTNRNRKSAFHNIFVGPDGFYVVPRWLLYLAMVWFVFQIEGWLVASFQTHLNNAWWQLIVETCMALAAIVPAFVDGAHR